MRPLRPSRSALTELALSVSQGRGRGVTRRIRHAIPIASFLADTYRRGQIQEYDIILHVIVNGCELREIQMDNITVRHVNYIITTEQPLKVARGRSWLFRSTQLSHACLSWRVLQNMILYYRELPELLSGRAGATG
eukprot:1030971-Pleurochrysis_carterae.AAC.1